MNAELWIKYNTVTFGITKPYFDKYKHLLKWKKNESVLEFACGDGRNSAKFVVPSLPEDYKEFVATDVTKGMVDYVKKNSKIPRLKTFEQDIENGVVTEDLKNRFDHIFGFGMLHLCKYPRKALDNIFDMLKPGGQTFITFLERTPADHAHALLINHPRWGKYGNILSSYYYHPNPRQAYEDDLKKVNFKDYIFAVEENVPLIFPDELTWKNIMVSVNRILPKIPESEKEEYIEDYLSLIEKTVDVNVTENDGRKVRAVNTNVVVILANKSDN